jgi:hypothetical protein
VFPSSYRSDAVTEESTEVKVEGQADLPDQTSRVGREGHGTHITSLSTDREGKQRYEEDIRVDVRNPQQRIHREEVRVYEQDRPEHERRERVEITRER